MLLRFTLKFIVFVPVYYYKLMHIQANKILNEILIQCYSCLVVLIFSLDMHIFNNYYFILFIGLLQI